MPDPKMITVRRPDAKRIFHFLNRRDHPARGDEIAEALDLPYTTVVNHCGYLRDEGFIGRTKVQGRRGWFFYAIKDNNPQQSLRDVQPKVATQLRVYWPYAQSFMTIPEIISWQNDNNKDLGQLSGTMYARMEKHIRGLIDGTLTQEDLDEFKKVTQSELENIRAHVQLWETYLGDFKHFYLDDARRILIDEDPNADEGEIRANIMRVALNGLWSTAQLEHQIKFPRQTLLGFFMASWNRPTTVEELHRLFPGIPVERLSYALENEKNGDFSLFKAIKSGRQEKWTSAFPEYRDAISISVAKELKRKGIIESMFAIQARDLDTHPLT